jgi:hypothetical protein
MRDFIPHQLVAFNAKISGLKNYYQDSIRRMRALLTEARMRAKEGYLRNYRREPQAKST